MADKTTSSLTAATTPLAGNELLYLIQSANSRKVAASEIVKISHQQAWSTITSTPTTLSGYGITDAQPLDSDLTAIAALDKTDGNFIVADGTAWTVESGATARTSLGLGSAATTDAAAYATAAQGATADSALQPDDIGDTVQGYDALLAAIAGLTTSSGDIVYATGSDAVSTLGIGTEGQVLKVGSTGVPEWGSVAGTGDMLASVYDPNAKAADAFDMSNMVEGTDAKIMTAAERTKLADAVTKSDTATTGFGFVVDEDDMASDSATKVPTQQSVKAYTDNTTVLKVADRTALKAVDTTVHTVVYLRESGREGQFVWNSSDLSTEVTADTAEGIYVAPTSDATGASGAWVRQYEGELLPEWFGAVGDGSTDDTAAIQAALDFAGVVKGNVTARGNIYIISAIIFIRAGVTLDGKSVATFKHKDGANLGDLFNFEDGAKFVNCIVDGNRQNNITDNAHVAVRIGNANDCLVEGCTIKSATGNGIGVNNGLRAVIRSNSIFDHYNIGITAFGINAEHDHEISANQISQFGWSGILLDHTDGCRVFNNNITGTIIGGRDGRLQVNTSGFTVTWVSGPNFSTLRSGNFVIINGGEEYRILTVDSSTQLTVDRTMPTLSNTEASAGTGDLLGVIASNFCVITGNTISRTTTFLFGWSLGNTEIQCGNNIFSNNALKFAGKNAINLNGAVGSGFLANNTITSNKIFNAGYGGGIGATDRIAIFLASGTPGRVSNTHVYDNTTVSFAGEGQTTYWLGTDLQVSFGSLFVQGNNAINVENKGIWNDVVEINLAAGWGSTANVAAIMSHGDEIIFTITCSGTGFAANPDLTVQKIADSPNDPPVPVAKIVSASIVPSKLNVMYGEQLSVRGQWKATMAGTPASGDAYTITMKAA